MTLAFSPALREIFVEIAFGSAGGVVGVVPAGGGVVPAGGGVVPVGGGVVPVGGGVVPVGGGVVPSGGGGVVPAGGGVVSVLVVIDVFFEDFVFFEDELAVVDFDDETLVVGEVFFEDDALPFVVVVVFFEDDACVVVDFGDDVDLLVVIFGDDLLVLIFGDEVFGAFAVTFGDEVFGAFAVIFGDFIVVPGLAASVTDAFATTSAATSINIRLMDMTLLNPHLLSKGMPQTWKVQVRRIQVFSWVSQNATDRAADGPCVGLTDLS